MHQCNFAGRSVQGSGGLRVGGVSYLGVSCGSAGVHDGTEVLRLWRIGRRWRLPAQIQERLPGVCFDARLLGCLQNSSAT